MKKHNVKLEWYVLNGDFNRDIVKKYNIFYEGFIDELEHRIKRDKVDNIEKFRNCIDSWAKYHYWSKTEFEIVVGDLMCRDLSRLEKIDVYYQLEMNLDNIVEYLINKLNIQFEKKPKTKSGGV